MKKITYPTASQAIHLLFTLCLYANLSAQHAIQSEWGYTSGTDKPGSTLALSWYHADAALSGNVIRLSYANVKEGFYYTDPMHIIQLDISRRWNSAVKNKGNVFFEAGLSGMMTNTRVRDSYTTINTIICDCETEEAAILFNTQSYVIEDQRDHYGVNFLYEVEDTNYLVEFLPGANVSLGIDVLLAKSFYMGIHIGGHLYYHVGLEKPVYYVQNGLHAGFRF